MATHGNILRPTATQFTTHRPFWMATHGNTLRPTATQFTTHWSFWMVTHGQTLRPTATQFTTHGPIWMHAIMMFDDARRQILFVGALSLDDSRLFNLNFSVLQRVAACCSVMPCFAVCCSSVPTVGVWLTTHRIQYVAVCCSSAKNYGRVL